MSQLDNGKTFNSFLRTHQTHEKGPQVWVRDCVSVGLGIIISLNAPALLLCSKAAFLYPTESNESSLGTRCGYFDKLSL